jgi:hypothetical protein
MLLRLSNVVCRLVDSIPGLAFCGKYRSRNELTCESAASIVTPAFAILLVDFIKGRGVCCKIGAQHVIPVLETMYFWQRCDLVAPTSGGIGCCGRDVVVVASVVAHGVCVFV